MKDKEITEVCKVAFQSLTDKQLSNLAWHLSRGHKLFVSASFYALEGLG